ncbi:MAG TPA: 2-oxoglutarate dehydrogenase complex dihydrolipoyllysine-residue succinyltransferase [Candidatus Binatia bacterium]|nr:2-oxoglutarate dehydrogenase complex dihydrolipoyllysine-residue succinyltransferase [Candidatus Binatia bacterium]
MPLELKVPSVGESITEVEISEWQKAEGESVKRDDVVAILETEKVTVELPAPGTGVITKILKKKGETAKVGDVIGYMEVDGKHQKELAEAKPQRDTEEKQESKTSEAEKSKAATDRDRAETKDPVRLMPAARRILAERGLKPEEVPATGPGGRLLKEDALSYLERVEESKAEQPTGEKKTLTSPDSDVREEEVVPMSPLRRRIAERLVEAQQTAALLTTFNEIDMTAVMALRRQYRESFEKKYSIKLGFMSFFVKASIEALKLIPQVNGEVRGTDIVYRNYYDIGIAIGGGRGLVVPVLRHAERMSFAEIERAIDDFARRAETNKLNLDELRGGTFTITNGGIYGSLLSTPIINPPQSGILGMHAIQERPVAREGQIVIRPMMYVALTYDHRIVDGREAVTFLRHIKGLLEDPARILLEV